MKAYNVGILGFGLIGKVHAYAHMNLPIFYDHLPFSTKISHICTSNKKTAERGCSQVNAEVPTTNYKDITENPKIDIVHVCAPNYLHKDMLLSAIKHNKHIYCDKPLVANSQEAEAIKEALLEYRGVAQMTFQNRFFPATIRAAQMSKDGFLGKVLEFRACYLHSGSADPKAPLKWKLSAGHGGGVIADLGSHVLDLIHHLIGDYDQVVASTRIAYPQRPSASDPAKMVDVDAEDCVMIIARMQNGAIGTIEATKTATGAEDELRFELHGSKGALRFNTMDPHHLGVYDATVSDKPFGGKRGWTQIDTGHRYQETNFPGAKFSIGWLQSHVACLFNFLQNVAEDEPGNPGLDQGIYIQRLLGRIRESASTCNWVKV